MSETSGRLATQSLNEVSRSIVKSNVYKLYKK